MSSQIKCYDSTPIIIISTAPPTGHWPKFLYKLQPFMFVKAEVGHDGHHHVSLFSAKTTDLVHGVDPAKVPSFKS
jgi:hypothetical protein